MGRFPHKKVIRAFAMKHLYSDDKDKVKKFTDNIRSKDTTLYDMGEMDKGELTGIGLDGEQADIFIKVRDELNASEEYSGGAVADTGFQEDDPDAAEEYSGGQYESDRGPAPPPPRPGRRGAVSMGRVESSVALLEANAIEAEKQKQKEQEAADKINKKKQHPSWGETLEEDFELRHEREREREREREAAAQADAQRKEDVVWVGKYLNTHAKKSGGGKKHKKKSKRKKSKRKKRKSTKRKKTKRR